MDDNPDPGKFYGAANDRQELPSSVLECHDMLSHRSGPSLTKLKGHPSSAHRIDLFALIVVA
jgi:hypothetical protein